MREKQEVSEEGIRREGRGRREGEGQLMPPILQGLLGNTTDEEA